jgi:hypothetical protein
MSNADRDATLQAQLSVLLESNSSDVTLDEIRERAQSKSSMPSRTPSARHKRVRGLTPALAWMLALIVLAGLGLGIGESLGGSGSHVISPKHKVSVLNPCSLLTRRQASELLGEPVIVETPNADICPYLGTKGTTEGTAPPGPPVPSISIETQRSELRPCRLTDDDCSMPNAPQPITVDAVRAVWTSRQYGEGQGHELTISTLALTYRGHFVNIAFEFSHPDEPSWPPLSMVEATMGDVVTNLKRLTS